ncbi:MAG: HDOD domain-containing protein [Spirochaetia bacterium]
MVDYTQLTSITEENVLASIQKHGGFSCTLPFANQESEQKLSSALLTIFNHIKKPELGNSLVYCLKEIVMNASKANSKRVYFKAKGLDIGNGTDYETGLKDFKHDVFGEFKKYEEQHRELEYYVRIDFKVDPDSLLIRVVNNSEISDKEEQRIAERLKIAGKFNSMEEVFSYGFDSTEGAGFGLIIVVLMLRSVGLDERVLSLTKKDGITTVLLRIPINLLSKTHGQAIAEEIAQEIERMPQFPDSLMRLQKNLNDPNADFNSVANIIKTDSALTTEIIRIANSPIYMLPRKVDDVPTAVRMIGLKGVKNLILSFGVNKVFEKKYKKSLIDEVMVHSYKVALYCSQIAKLKRMDPLIDDIYVAAMLHDFGKIITSTLQPELVDKINKICATKGIPLSSLEDLTKGYNHSIIGSQLSQKWNFPEKFVQAVKYHHIPLEASQDYKSLVYVIYLGNEIYYYTRDEHTFGDINYLVLKFFNLTDQKGFDEFVQKIVAALEKKK